MQSLLKRVSEQAIILNEIEYDNDVLVEKWLGKNGADETEIENKEKELAITFPVDFRNFLMLTNGFLAASYTEPNFLSIDKIDFFRNVYPEIIEAYSIEGIEDIGAQLNRSILIAGYEEEQYFLLIPPINESKKWGYWKFANWIPGEQKYDSLQDYFTEVLDFLLEENSNEKTDELGEVIAERILTFIENGEERELIVKLGKPRKDNLPGGDWECPIQIGKSVKMAYGVGTFQALTLALKLIEIELQNSGLTDLNWLGSKDLGF